MRSLFRRSTLTTLMALVGVVSLVGMAVAQPPWVNADDVDDTFTWSVGENEEGETVIFWSVGEDEEGNVADCTEENENREADCSQTVVEASEGEDPNHGDFVSAFAQDAPEGPGRGCLIAQIATSDEGKPEESTTDNDNDDNGENGHKGCPAGLYDWLQTFTGENAGEGQPQWVQDMLSEKGVGAAGNGNGGNGGPPIPVPGGPGNGNG